MFIIANNRIANLLAIISGLLFTCAFAPFNIYISVFLSLFFFRFILNDLTLKQASIRGFLFGLGLFGSGVSWIFVSMTIDANVGYFIPILVTFLYCSFWALFPAIFAYSFVILKVEHPFLDALLFSCLWISIEYIRGEWILNGFPWLQISYSQLDTLLSGYIPIFGVYGTGFIVVLFAIICAESLFIKRGIKLSVILVGILLILGVFLQQINWTFVSGESFKVALIQGNISQKDKWLLESRNRTLKQYYEDTIQNWDADLIIWPETAVPAYYDEVKDYLQHLELEAIKYNSSIITSMPYQDNNGGIFNSVWLLGKERQYYKKIHLLPFGEYLPWQPVSGIILNLMEVRIGQFSAGTIEQPLLFAAGYHFLTSICYEDAFGQQNIEKVKQAHFLVNVTNDSWFDGSIEPYQHMQIARMRALESGRYLLRVTNTGVTVVISEKGAILQQAEMLKHTVIRAKVLPMQGLTPYAQIGNTPIMLFIVVLLIILIAFKFLRVNHSS